MTRAYNVDRLFPTPLPEPVANCDVCASLAKRRAAAQAIGDHSGVIDCNIRIRRHAHGHEPIPV